MIKNICILVAAALSISASAAWKTGENVEGEFEVVSEYGSPAINYNGMFVTMVIAANAPIDSLVAFQYLRERIKFRRPIQSNVTLKGELTRGRNALGTEAWMVKIENLSTPDLVKIPRGQVYEVTFWQGALRVVQSGNLFPVIAANRSDIQKVESDIERIADVAKANGVVRTFARIDGHLGRTWTRQTVMAAEYIGLADDDEAAGAGFSPHKPRQLISTVACSKNVSGD